MTLLEIVQGILSSMDSDEVNSITDTTESAQVALLVKTTYYDIISRANLPEHETLFNLTPSTDNLKPTLMTVPSNINNVRWVKYNCMTGTDTVSDFRVISPVSIEEFLRIVQSYDTDDTSVGTMTLTIGTSTVVIPFYNDTAPSMYTTYDDYTILFNSYDSAVDTTLQQSKTLCFGQTGITWTHTDSFVPDLDERQFSLLYNEAKSLAFAELKQTEHKKAEKVARRGWTSLMKTKDRVDVLTDFQKLPNYGRHR